MPCSLYALYTIVYFVYYCLVYIGTVYFLEQVGKVGKWKMIYHLSTIYLTRELDCHKSLG